MSQWFFTHFAFLKLGRKGVSLTITIETLILMSFGFGNIIHILKVKILHFP